MTSPHASRLTMNHGTAFGCAVVEPLGGWVFLVMYGQKHAYTLEWAWVGIGLAVVYGGGVATTATLRMMQPLFGFDSATEHERRRRRLGVMLEREEREMQHPVLHFLLFPGSTGFFYVPLLTHLGTHPTTVLATVRIEMMAEGATDWRRLEWWAGVIVKAAAVRLLLPHGSLLAVTLIVKSGNLLIARLIRRSGLLTAEM